MANPLLNDTGDGGEYLLGQACAERGLEDARCFLRIGASSLCALVNSTSIAESLAPTARRPPPESVPVAMWKGQSRFLRE